MTASPAAATARLILALNCGSSSIKFALFDAGTRPMPRQPLWGGSAQGIGTTSASWGEQGGEREPLALDAGQPYGSALQKIHQRVRGYVGAARLALVVHRVVHGGERYAAPVRLDAGVLEDLVDCIPLAPLHQPHALEAIRLMLQVEPDVPQVACFDTAFHHSMPVVEKLLPLPWEAWQRGLRRYGFHGLSYAYVATALEERYGEAARGRVIVAHLGSGASLCAMRDLRSVATTMGFSALEGLMMGTRSGSVDPGVLLHLLEVEGHTPPQVGRLLYHQSGLLGVSGISSEPRVLLRHEADAGEQGERARLAMALYVRRIVREIGALTALLGGLDMLVFTAGVGENSAPVRQRVCEALSFLGVRIDAGANEHHLPLISHPASPVRVAIEPTNEEWLAATQALALLDATSAPTTGEPT
jgi:acetate kinase